MRKAFTLVELLIVITIIGILTALSWAALLNAAEVGRVSRAKSQVAKIDQIISEYWNGYRFKQLPIRVPSGTSPLSAVQLRLNAIRELQRLELPDRMSDIVDNPVVLTSNAKQESYRRYFNGTTASSNSSNEAAECLYAIIANTRDGDKSALEYFMNSEVGDTDQDGAYEILDPWGTPIMLLRWPAGYIGQDVATHQSIDKPDPFDPLKVDVRWSNGTTPKPYLLSPLIVSAGPDKVYDLYVDDLVVASKIHYNATTPPNDPYVTRVYGVTTVQVGSLVDYDSDGLQNGDNLTNHILQE